jgi:hypothetical protein
VLHRSTLTDEERDALAKGREYWKERKRNDSFKIQLNDDLVSPRRFIDTYFNGLYFHRDADKREEREFLEAVMGGPFVRALLLEWVTDLTSAAAFIEQIVVRVLDRGMQ